MTKEQISGPWLMELQYNGTTSQELRGNGDFAKTKGIESLIAIANSYGPFDVGDWVVKVYNLTEANIEIVVTTDRSELKTKGEEFKMVDPKKMANILANTLDNEEFSDLQELLDGGGGDRLYEEVTAIDRRRHPHRYESLWARTAKTQRSEL